MEVTIDFNVTLRLFCGTITETFTDICERYFLQTNATEFVKQSELFVQIEFSRNTQKLTTLAFFYNF